MNLVLKSVTERSVNLKKLLDNKAFKTTLCNQFFNIQTNSP